MGKQVLFSYEEAIGFCIGDIVRDKDGVVAVAVFTEMAQYLKNEKQLSVTAHLDQLCQKYGYFAQYNGYLYWRDQKKIDQIFSRLRNNGHYWLRVGKYKIKHVRDLTNEGYDSEQSDGKPKLPVSKSNMLTYTFENGCVATFRLSGRSGVFVVRLITLMIEGNKEKNFDLGRCEAQETIRSTISPEWHADTPRSTYG